MPCKGTVAVEFLGQAPFLDAIIVPVSGGGLISGISIAAKSLKPQIKIIAAEPSGNLLLCPPISESHPVQARGHANILACGILQTLAASHALPFALVDKHWGSRS